MQTLRLGMNTLKGRIGLEWDSWMAGMEKTVQWRAAKEDQRRRQALLPLVVLRGQECFPSRAPGHPPAMASGVSPCVSTETRLGMLQAIRGNVMPQWEFRREKKKQIKGSEI